MKKLIPAVIMTALIMSSPSIMSSSPRSFAPQPNPCGPDDVGTMNTNQTWISNTAQVDPTTSLGRFVKICSGAMITGNSIIGDHAAIGKNVHLDGVEIGVGTKIGFGSKLRMVKTGSHVRIGRNVNMGANDDSDGQSLVTIRNILSSIHIGDFVKIRSSNISDIRGDVITQSDLYNSKPVYLVNDVTQSGVQSLYYNCPGALSFDGIIGRLIGQQPTGGAVILSESLVRQGFPDFDATNATLDATVKYFIKHNSYEFRQKIYKVTFYGNIRGSMSGPDEYSFLYEDAPTPIPVFDWSEVLTNDPGPLLPTASRPSHDFIRRSTSPGFFRSRGFWEHGYTPPVSFVPRAVNADHELLNTRLFKIKGIQWEQQKAEAIKAKLQKVWEDNQVQLTLIPPSTGYKVLEQFFSFVKNEYYEATDEVGKSLYKFSKAILTQLYESSSASSPGCPICFESLAPGAGDGLRVTSCHHAFCKPCFDMHTVNSTTCPLCRQQALDHSFEIVIF